MPNAEFLWPMFSQPWLLTTVSVCATPGMMPFGPPLNPAKKCGSMNPVMIRTSALARCVLMSAGAPVLVTPNCVQAASLSGS